MNDSKDFFCQLCSIDCKNAEGLSMHSESRMHSLAVANAEEEGRPEADNMKKEDEIDGFFCTLCNIDCHNEEGVAMHCQSRIHSVNRANSEFKDEDEEEEEDMDDDDVAVTYCSVCRVECKTPGGFFTHTKSVSHMIRASESGTMETVHENQEVNDEDKGPLYCRPCKLMCKNEDEFSFHTQTIGHHMKQRKYDQQQRLGDSRAPGQWSSGPQHHDRRPMPYAAEHLDQPMDYRYQEQIEEPQPHPDHPELLVDAIEPGISMCTVCNARLRTSYFTHHLQAPRHRRRLRAVSAGGSIYAHTAGLATRPLPGPADMQKDLDENTSWLVGMEYIYEIHRRTTIGKPYYLCTLCDVGYIEVVSHVTCKDHRQLYFKKHSEELEDIVWPYVPRPDTEFFPWYCAKYTRQALETEVAPKRPKPSQETTMLVRMAMGVCKKCGVQTINKHEEIRGKIVRPDGHLGKDPYPNARPIDKWNGKRLFVGNLPLDVNEMALLDFLNRQTIDRAIIDLEMGKDKKFAFITFRSYEDTTQFLIFDGIVFKDTELRVTRPHNYRPLPGQDDAKVLHECTIPRAALLYNKVLPYPPGSKHTNSLHIKGLPSRVEPEIIMEYINSLVLGMPATGVNEISLKHRENWACFVTFRSTEETTDVLEAALGELFHFRPISITRPTNYVSPEEVLAKNEIDNPKAHMPPGGKRQIDDMPPLYTNFQKISRMEPTPNEGFRGGSMGFVKPSDTRPHMPGPHQRAGPPGPYGMEGQHNPQAYGFDRNQGQAQYQGHGAKGTGYGSNQGHGDYQQQGQMRGQGQGRGQYHGDGQGQYQGQGQNQARSQFQGQKPNQNQYQYQDQDHGEGHYGQEHVQGQGHFQAQSYNQKQRQNQNPGQGGKPPVPHPGVGGSAVHTGQPDEYYGQPAEGASRGPPPPRPGGPLPPGPRGPPPPVPGGRPPPPSSGGYMTSPLPSGPQPYSEVEFPMAKLPPPQLPPPPRVTQLTTMLRESKEILTNDTICTDEEAVYAQQVAMQLAGGLKVYNAKKNLKKTPFTTTMQAPKDADLEEWLKYVSYFLDKGRIALEEEATLAQEMVDLLMEEVKKYQDRCTLTPAVMTQTATSSAAAAAVSTAMPPMPAYNYQNYMAYGQYYGQYANSTYQ